VTILHRPGLAWRNVRDLSGLRVVNDAAEPGVKLVTDSSQML